MKDSPNAWVTCPLTAVSDIVSGVAKGRQLGGATVTVPYLRVANVQAGHLDLSEVKEIEVLETEVSKYRLIAGDILMTEGGDRDKLGRGTIWRGQIDPCIHQNHVFRVRPAAESMLPEFLNYYMLTPQARSYFLQCAKQTTGIASINRTQLSGLPVPLPPLAEQRRIAAILDKADAIRRKRTNEYSLLAELPRSIFIDMFGDPGTNPQCWPLIRVEELLNQDRAGTRCGPFGTALTKAEYVGEGVPVWGIDNVLPNKFREARSLFITPAKFDEMRSYSVESGDLLISRAGTVGRVCVARPTMPESIIGTNLIRVSVNPQRLVPEYLSTLLTYFSDRIGDLRASSDQDAYSFMKTGVLTRLRIPLPDLPRQQRFATALVHVGTTADRHTAAQDETENLFHSLVQRAFRGEL